MKKLILILAAALPLALTTEAQNFTTPVKPRWYAGIDAGAQFIQDIGVKQGLGIPLSGAVGSFDPGPRLGVTFGLHLDPNWRVELDTGVAYNTARDFTVGGVSYATAGSADVWSVPLIANVVWTVDPQTGLLLRPFFGVGAGAHYVNGSLNIPGLDFTDSGDSFVFAWQLKAGFICTLTDKLQLTVSYRLLNALNHKIKLTEFEDATIHSISVGLEGRF